MTLEEILLLGALIVSIIELCYIIFSYKKITAQLPNSAVIF